MSAILRRRSLAMGFSVVAADGIGLRASPAYHVARGTGFAFART